MFKLLVKDINLTTWYKITHLTKELFTFLFIYVGLFTITSFILSTDGEGLSNSLFIVVFFNILAFTLMSSAFLFTMHNSNSFFFQLEKENEITDVEYNFLMEYRLFYKTESALWKRVFRVLNENVTNLQNPEFVNYLNFLKDKKEHDKYETWFIQTYNNLIITHKDNLSKLEQI
jgi:hypothetical protein